MSQVESFQKCESLIDNFCGNNNVLLFTSILEWLDVNQGIKLDDEQQMAYEVICLSFLLKLLNGDEVNDYDGTSNVTSGNVTETLNKELRCLAKDAEKWLSAYGGEKTAVNVLNRACWCEKKHCSKSCRTVLYDVL